MSDRMLVIQVAIPPAIRPDQVDAYCEAITAAARREMTKEYPCCTAS